MKAVVSTTVSPSPRDLVVRLSNEERVAIDLLLQDCHEGRLAEMVPAESPRCTATTTAPSTQRRETMIIKQIVFFSVRFYNAAPHKREA